MSDDPAPAARSGDARGRLGAVLAAATTWFMSRTDGAERATARLASALRQERQAREDLERNAARLEHLAHHDHLTDLPNRTLFEAELRIALAQAKRSGESVVVCSLDVDKFKLVNDTLGHGAGDALLHATAERLRGCVRDEFGLILPVRASEASVAAGVIDDVVERIQDSFQDPFPVADTEVYTSVSLGFAVFPEESSDGPELLRRADARMYRQKREADSYITKQAVIYPERDNELELARRLHESARADGWQLRYQSIVELSYGNTVGSEALVRWTDPLFGLRPPGDFLPLVEELGLAPVMSDWVMSQLATDLTDWQREGVLDRLTMVSFNMSPRELWHPALEERVGRLIAGIPRPDALVLEVTESAISSDPHRIRGLLRNLRSSGVRLALDDFGTGYSSLARLRSLPFDIVKIDRAFIQDIDHDESARRMIRSVVRLLGSLGMVAVAEGIETERQRAIIAEEGCVFAQGFLFGPPVKAERFAIETASAPVLLG
jgi:diguanylate cyclase (GGDEF)-like protein